TSPPLPSTLSLHDALPIYFLAEPRCVLLVADRQSHFHPPARPIRDGQRNLREAPLGAIGHREKRLFVVTLAGDREIGRDRAAVRRAGNPQVWNRPGVRLAELVDPS